MGHTVWSQRIVTDVILNELHAYGESLRSDEKEVYVDLLRVPLKRMGSISYANSMHTWAFLMLSILLEQERKIRELERERAQLRGQGRADE